VTIALKYVDNQNNNQTATAQASFAVAGPSNPNVVTCGGNVPSGTCPNGTNGPLGQVVISPGPYIQLGGTQANVGIQFSASATPPTGYSNAFTWVQLVTNDTKVVTPNTGATQTCVPLTQPAGASTWLDT
jgi:hypothetical protein